MAIIQISKIQQRSGNLVDLPQLDEAEFGWASDAKRLFIGKTTPNENIEVLTSYSQINYSQLNGAVGNLNISNVTVADGQVLTFDGNNWVNRGGDAGGLITLGDASNVKITGGAIGYVLETDGLGNLSWTPKSTVIAFIQNVTTANPAVVTTTQDNFFTDGAEITITNAAGMTDLNGNTYYANVLTSNTFSLYSDPSLTTPINSIAFTNNTYSYTTATSTSASTNRVTIGNSALFNLNQEVLFLGDLSTSGLENNVSYYIKAKPSGTTITVSEELLANGVAGNTKVLTTATLTGSNVYASGGRAIASVSSGGGGSGAAGSNTTVQFNNSNLLDGDADFTWNFGASPKVLGIVGNANVGNLNASGIVTSTQLISNIATGTAPLTVTSTTRVANLNVSYANVSDFGVVTAQTTGTYFPVFVNSSSTGNRALAANANLSFNAATGALSATLLGGTLTTAAQPNITSVGTLTSLAVTGNANTGNLGTTTLIATTGNITTVNSGLLQNGTSNVAVAGSGGNVTLGVAGTTRITATSTGANVTGTLGVSSTLSVTGNANVGNLGTAQVLASANVTAPQLISNVSTGTAPLVVSSTTLVANLNADLLDGYNSASAATAATIVLRDSSGNIFGNYIYGNGSTLESITGANVTGQVGNALVSGTVYTAAQPNITSVGTLTSLAVSGTSGITSTDSSAAASTTKIINAINGTRDLALIPRAGAGSYNTLTAADDALITFANSSAQGNANLTIAPWASANTGIRIQSVSNTATIFLNASTTNVSSTMNIGGNTTLTTSSRPYLTINTTSSSNRRAALALATSGTVQFETGVDISLNNSRNYYIYDGPATATRMLIDSNGNVGFGTTSPNGRVQVSGASALNAPVLGNTANVPLYVTNNDGSYGLVAGTNASDGHVWLQAQRADGSATAYNMTLNEAGGNVGIGNASPAHTLSVNGNIFASTGVQTTVLSTGANTTAGSITGNWTLTAGSRMQATYADLAEYYEADDIYVPGTVLMFGGEKEVTLSEDETNRVAGVVSTNPAYVMNSTCPGLLTAVALQGRVPCKVRGKITKGDMLVSAGDGFAKSNMSPSIGTVIGKALQDFDGHEGIIEVAVGRL